MIGMTCANPSNTRSFSLFNGQLGRMVHHQMPQPVVAINQRRGCAIFKTAKFRRRVQPTCPQSFDIHRQAKHTVPILAHQIGLHHQTRRSVSVFFGEPTGHETAGDKGVQGRVRDQVLGISQIKYSESDESRQVETE